MNNRAEQKKMILAILQGNDYADTVEKLNQEGFFATVLSSTGGFLKKTSVTLMIGIDAECVQRVLDILKQYSGRRVQMAYSDAAMSAGGSAPGVSMIPVQVCTGGVVAFIMDLSDIQKC